jgi:hypothetical protein
MVAAAQAKAIRCNIWVLLSSDGIDVEAALPEHIPKSGYRFSEKIMLQRENRVG